MVRALDLALSLGFMVTPIVYPIPKVWPASLFADLNPLVPLLDTTRQWMEGSATIPLPSFFAVSALSFAALIAGWFLYRVATPHLVSRL